MQPPNALLDAVGVPGQLIIDHQMAELQVDSLTCGIGGQHEVNIRLLESFLSRGGLFEICMQSAVAFAAEEIVQPRQRHQPLIGLEVLLSAVIERYYSAVCNRMSGSWIPTSAGKTSWIVMPTPAGIRCLSFLCRTLE